MAKEGKPVQIDNPASQTVGGVSMPRFDKLDVSSPVANPAFAMSPTATQSYGNNIFNGSTRERIAFLRTLAQHSPGIAARMPAVESAAAEEPSSESPALRFRRSRSVGDDRSEESRSSIELNPADAQHYIVPYAWIFALLDALTFGVLHKVLGGQRVHDRILFIANSARIPRCCRGRRNNINNNNNAIFFLSPLLSPTVNFFNGTFYAKHLGMQRILGMIAGIVGMLLLATGISLSDGENSVYRSLVPPVIEFSDAVLAVWIQPGFSYMKLSFFFIISCQIAGVCLVVSTLTRADRSTMFGLRKNALPAVLPLIVKPQHPFVMVSYPWVEPILHTARSLAFSLPDVWLDVKWLVSGVHIPSTTAAVAKHTYCLIMMMNNVYLERAACCTEFISAVMHRRAADQITLVYADDTLPSTIVSLLRSSGFVVFGPSSVTDMLTFLDTHIYRCESQADLKRAIQWFQRYSTPLQHVNRRSLLPSPAVVARQSRLALCGTCRAPAKSVEAGGLYLAPDASRVGYRFKLGREQVILMINCLFGTLAAACFAVHCQKQECPSALLGLGPVVNFLFFVALVVTSYPLLLDTDIRRTHHSVLLPLNVAAYCGELAHDTLQSKVTNAMKLPSALASPSIQSAKDAASSEQLAASVGFKVIFFLWEPEPGSKRGAFHAKVEQQFENLTTFLQLCGIHACVERIPLNTNAGMVATEFQSRVRHRTSAGEPAVCTFVLTSPHAQQAWTQAIRPIWPAEATVLVVDSISNDTPAEIKSYMLLMLGDKNGISPQSPYDGFATAMLDSIAAKVGHAFTSHRPDFLDFGTA